MWRAGLSFLVIGAVHADPPTVSIYAVKLVSPEANASPGFNMATVEVVRSGDTVAPLAVRYTTGGVALVGTDFHLLSPWQRRTVSPGSITIPRGYASVQFMVAPVDNHKQDGVRSVEFRLSPGTDYKVETTNGAATVYLTDVLSSIKTISTGGVQRHYFYHRPAGLNRSGKVPLLVFLNGSTVSGDDYYAGFGVLADQKGFVIVAPRLDDPELSPPLACPITLTPPPTRRAVDGYVKGGHWTSGASYPKDQLVFLGDLIDALAVSDNIDRTRVYLLGTSGGAMTALRIARDLSSRWAAVCASSGKMMGISRPLRPIALLDMHYVTDSPVVNTSYVPGMMHQWALWNGCPMTSRRTQSQDITTDIWHPGRAGSMVESIVINPTSYDQSTPRGVGHTFNPGFPNAESVVWSFLSQFRISPDSFLNGDGVAPDAPILAATATAADTITLHASGVKDNVRVVRLELLVDGVVEQTIPDPATYLDFTWNSRRAANGTHPLQLLAYDAAGSFTPSNVVMVKVENDLTRDTGAPTGLSFRNVREGDSITGYRQVDCSASDDKGIMEVDLLVDEAVAQRAYSPVADDTFRFDFNPYSCPWSGGPMTSGSHTLRLIAYDAAGHSASASVIVNVEAPPDEEKPTCKITSPANGAPVSGIVEIQATATDAGSIDLTSGIPKVTRVEFLIDGVVVATSVATDPTHSYPWDTGTAPTGAHTLEARATDNAGQYCVKTSKKYTPDHSALSSPVNVTVRR